MTSRRCSTPAPLVAPRALPYHRAMSKRKSPGGVPGIDERISFGGDAAHLSFQRQVADLLDQADLTEDQRQEILIAMNCPCCGAGGLSLSIKIGSGPETPSF